MDTSQLLESIRGDFVTEIRPFIMQTSVSSMKNFQDVENALHATKQILMKSTLQTSINIVARNTYEWVFHNLFKENLQFPQRVAFRAISASMAAMTSSLVLDRRIGIGNMVLYPLWQGFYFGVYYMIHNAEETKRYFKKNYPKQIDAIMQNEVTGNLLRFIQGVYQSLNNPSLPYEQRMRKDKYDPNKIADKMQHKLDKLGKQAKNQMKELGLDVE